MSKNKLSLQLWLLGYEKFCVTFFMEKMFLMYFWWSASRKQQLNDGYHVLGGQTLSLFYIQSQERPSDWLDANCGSGNMRWTIKMTLESMVSRSTCTSDGTRWEDSGDWSGPRPDLVLRLQLTCGNRQFNWFIEGDTNYTVQTSPRENVPWRHTFFPQICLIHNWVHNVEAIDTEDHVKRLWRIVLQDHGGEKPPKSLQSHWNRAVNSAHLGLKGWWPGKWHQQ